MQGVSVKRQHFIGGLVGVAALPLVHALPLEAASLGREPAFKGTLAAQLLLVDPLPYKANSIYAKDLDATWYMTSRLGESNCMVVTEGEDFWVPILSTYTPPTLDNDFLNMLNWTGRENPNRCISSQAFIADAQTCWSGSLEEAVYSSSKYIPEPKLLVGHDTLLSLRLSPSFLPAIYDSKKPFRVGTYFADKRELQVYTHHRVDKDLIYVLPHPSYLGVMSVRGMIDKEGEKAERFGLGMAMMGEYVRRIRVLG